MKKKELKNLALNRKTISNLESNNTVGGNTAQNCVRTFVDANGNNICLVTLDCQRTEYCVPVSQKECVSVFIDCITQTETPTCRNCA
jgi:hypothetical protein